jgi:hypothetical protein
MCKRKYNFSDSLKQQFPFIKNSVGGDSSKVECALLHAVLPLGMGRRLM